MVYRSHFRKLAMMPSKLTGLFAVLTMLGCKEIPHKAPNMMPTAKAQAVGPDGMLANPATFTFTGSNIDVTLDGSGSNDPDGQIVTYHWFSANAVADGGVGNLTGTFFKDAGGVAVPINAGVRTVPAGQPRDWPGLGKRVTVSLGEGIYNFSLFVIDNRGGTSMPSTVTITIGKPDPLTDPTVKACYDGTVTMLSDACRKCVCSIDDTCRMAVQKSACDEKCWGLINCIGAKCPDFMAMAAKMDYSCFTTNCSSFGIQAGATAAGMCAVKCPDDCKAMDMGAAGAGASGSSGGSAGMSAGTAGMSTSSAGAGGM